MVLEGRGELAMLLMVRFIFDWERKEGFNKNHENFLIPAESQFLHYFDSYRLPCSLRSRLCSLRAFAASLLLFSLLLSVLCRLLPTWRLTPLQASLLLCSTFVMNRRTTRYSRFSVLIMNAITSSITRSTLWISTSMFCFGGLRYSCGTMVLDALFKIKNEQDPTFAFRR